MERKKSKVLVCVRSDAHTSTLEIIANSHLQGIRELLDLSSEEIGLCYLKINEFKVSA